MDASRSHRGSAYAVKTGCSVAVGAGAPSLASSHSGIKKRSAVLRRMEHHLVAASLTLSANRGLLRRAGESAGWAALSVKDWGESYKRTIKSDTTLGYNWSLGAGRRQKRHVAFFRDCRSETCLQEPRQYFQKRFRLRLLPSGAEEKSAALPSESVSPAVKR